MLIYLLYIFAYSQCINNGYNIRVHKTIVYFRTSCILKYSTGVPYK